MTQLEELLQEKIHAIELNAVDSLQLGHLSDNNYLLDEELKQFKAASPVITALKLQGAHQLVQVLNASSDESLVAFAMLTGDNPELNDLVHIFLIKTHNELDLINRPSLMSFLSQPDLASTLRTYLESLERKASNTMSRRFINLAMEPSKDAIKKLASLRHFLSDHPFTIQDEALLDINSIYGKELILDHHSAISSAYIELVYHILMGMRLERQNHYIQLINQNSLLFIIDHCVRGLASNETSKQKMCAHMLFLICSQINSRDTECRTLVRECLQRPTSFSVDLPKTNSQSNWIEELLTSPAFVASCSLPVLKQLIERYSLIVLLSRPKDGKHLIDPLKIKSDLGKQINKCFHQISKLAAVDPNSQELLLAKKTRLFQFSVSTELDEVLFQLEERCEKVEAPVKQKALTTLYNFYRHSSDGLREDLLYPAIDLAYRQVPHNQTKDSVLKSWVLKYEILLEMEDGELSRKKEVVLYNVDGKKIAYLNRANEAICFVDAEPELLIHSAIPSVDETVYDAHKKPTGQLTPSGQVKKTDLYHTNLCAQLLTAVPITELEQSPIGLDLIIEQVLFENSLDALFSGNCALPDNIRGAWLERQLCRVVSKATKAYDPTTLSRLLTKLTDDSLFSLLAGTQCRENALYIWNELLNQQSTREKLLSGACEADFHNFLDKHGVAFCLAEYLTQNYSKPWFKDGLTRFTLYGKKHNNYTVLNEALRLLKVNADKNAQAKTTYDSILERVVYSEESAELVLKDFLNDTSYTAVQKTSDPELSKLTAHFSKRHLISAIKALNQTSYWNEKFLYKLVLHILNNRHKQFFANPPIPTAWDATELHELGVFLSRHLCKARKFDHQNIIGHRLLGDLIFGGAQAGQISLFYNKDSLNPLVSRLSITYPFLVRLIDKYYVSEGMREHFPEDMQALAHDPKKISEAFKKQNSVNDWTHLLNQTWTDNSEVKLPLICIYLLNYNGQKKPLMLLLANYFKGLQNEPAYIHPVARLLQQFPQRDFTSVVFDALVLAVINNPSLLDKAVLRYMAQYYAAIKCKKIVSPIEAELDLLIYFGQNKQYDLVKIGCEELAETCEDLDLRKRLLRGALEANVEKKLNGNIGHFYFIILKMLQRLWHYGFNASKKASNIVKLCDDRTAGPDYKLADNAVHAPSIDVTTNHTPPSFKKRKTVLIDLLAAVNQALNHKLKKTIVPSTHSIFNDTETKTHNNSNSAAVVEAVY